LGYTAVELGLSPERKSPDPRACEKKMLRSNGGRGRNREMLKSE
jgi:hypothetical protein